MEQSWKGHKDKSRHKNRITGVGKLGCFMSASNPYGMTDSIIKIPKVGVQLPVCVCGWVGWVGGGGNAALVRL